MELDRAFRRLRELLSPRTRFAIGASGVAEPDLRYEDLAALIGGCNTRASEQGVYFALAHESLVEELCAHELASAPAIDEIQTLLQERTRLHFARDPTPAEVDGVGAALTGCGEECTGRNLAFSLCSAVAGSGEMLFY